MQCKFCILSWMSLHPELLFFKKCNTCGYTEFDSESYSRHPGAPKLATYRMMLGFEPVPDEDKSKEPCSATSSHKE